MSVHVFDVDGCMADTLPLVRRCYAEASGADVTEGHVRRPWQEWLPDLVGDRADEVRARKTALYLEALEREPPRRLPAGELALKLLSSGERVYAVTAAKPSVAPAVLRAAGLTGLVLIGDPVTPDERPDLVLSIAAEGTYYDDDLGTCRRVEARTPWHVVYSPTV